MKTRSSLSSPASHVAPFEAHVPEAEPRRLLARRGDRLLADVVAGEAAVGVSAARSTSATAQVATPTVVLHASRDQPVRILCAAEVAATIANAILVTFDTAAVVAQGRDEPSSIA